MSIWRAMSSSPTSMPTLTLTKRKRQCSGAEKNDSSLLCVSGAEDFRGDTSDEPDWTLDGDGYPKWIQGSGRIPDAVLRQYIIYARKYCQPELRSQDEERLTTFYSKLREATSRNGGLPMTVRHLESIMRMATANAKMRLARYAE